MKFTDSYSEHGRSWFDNETHEAINTMQRQFNEDTFFICPILILFLRVYAFYFDLYFDICLQNVHLGFMAMIVKKVAALTVLYLGHVTG